MLLILILILIPNFIHYAQILFMFKYIISNSILMSICNQSIYTTSSFQYWWMLFDIGCGTRRSDRIFISKDVRTVVGAVSCGKTAKVSIVVQLLIY